MTFAAIGTISACLFVIGIFYTVVSNVEYMLDKVEKEIGVAVFFNDNVSEEKILEIQKLVENRDDVHRTTYISPEEAWDKFKKENFKGKEDLLITFEDDNPLKDSSSIQVFIKNIKYQDGLVDYLESMKEVRYVRKPEEKLTSVMQNFNELVKYSSVVLIIILILISVFLISNSIRLAITLRKNEISIMKYIGAKDSLIRGPFLIEGVLIGISGTIVPLSIIYIFYDNVIAKLNTQFPILDDYLAFLNVNEVFSKLIPLSIAIGIVIGLVGSRLTIHKHLQV
jgi:cell division transport system permease protein